MSIYYIGESQICDLSYGTYIDNKIIINNYLGNIRVTFIDGSSYDLCIMKSDLPSIELSLNGISLSEVNHNSKDIKYQGTYFKLVDIYGNEIIDDNTTFKGRGNTSWGFDKKSYQIKLNKKNDLLMLGKQKTWLLISNAADASLIRNKLMFDLANDLHMPYAQQSDYIDLWINGEYIGNYLLVEKIQIGENRVELSQNDGLLIEMDNNYYSDEDFYFKSEYGNNYFVLKDSVADDVTKENSESINAFYSFQEYINSFEKLLYSNNKDWNAISSMIDVDSFIDFYFFQEFSENIDGVRGSVYMYKDGEEDVLHIGPVWDFDASLGNDFSEINGGNPNIEYIINARKRDGISCDYYDELFEIPEFKQLAYQRYNSYIKQIFLTYKEKISTYNNLLVKSAEMNFKKCVVLNGESLWGEGFGHKYMPTWQDEIDIVYEFIEKRLCFFDSNFNVNEESTTEESITEELTTEETTTEESIAEELTTEKIATEESTTEELTTEEIATEEIATEESTTEELIIEESVKSTGTIMAADVFIAKTSPSIIAAFVAEKSNSNDVLEYRWVACEEGNPNVWFEVSPWTKGNYYLSWVPKLSGDYIFVAYARVVGNEEESEVYKSFGVNYRKGVIKGICQMPYEEGYLIGIESYDNPNQSYQYEMLVMDLSIFAAGDPNCWVHRVKGGVLEGNALWTLWKPQYGYFITLFRLYDGKGNIIDQTSYGFANVY